MVDYIEREAAKKALTEYANWLWVTFHEPCNLSGWLSVIDSVPDAFCDVKPVVRGKWKLNSDSFYPYCSNCRCDALGRILTDFCPYCGADMREDEDE